MGEWLHSPADKGSPKRGGVIWLHEAFSYGRNTTLHLGPLETPFAVVGSY